MKGNPMSNPVCFFEIPVTDLDRAIAFYQAVFECRLEKGQVDGNEMAFFPVGDGEGISGALARGDSYCPGTQGPRIYFNSRNIEQTLKRVETAGGRILYPLTSVGELGWVAEFEDSEGNCIALHSR